jgi:copper resistance protein C
MKTVRLTVMVALISIASIARAHTHLSSSEPADGSIVTAPPTSFVANFSEATRVTALVLTKEGGKDEKLALPTGATQRVSAALPKLEPGKYVLTWRAVGNDSHVMSGKISFTFDPNGKAVAGKADEHKHSH